MENTIVRDPYFPAKPLADFSGSRWSLPLAHRLVTASLPLRFRELQRDVPGISAQELTRLLRRFETQGLLIREDTFEMARRITYRPSHPLLEASTVLDALASWSRTLADVLSVTQDRERV